MIHSTADQIAAAPATAAKVPSAVQRIRDAFRRRLELREMRREITLMDDHILRDIGLRREDLMRDLEIIAAERRMRINAARAESRRHTGAPR